MSTTIELSLDKVRRLAARFGPYTRPTIHVTGTNGKGSVTSFVTSILHESGMKVGRFNSPHLIHVRDSISINGSAISEERYRKTRAEVEHINNFGISSSETSTQSGIGASLFEVLTVTAFRVFEEEKVDVAVVEVGMGGRLDATNILPESGVVKASAITAVDIDHVKWLGNSVAAIAKEKGGIARRDAPLVLGPQKWKEVESVVKECVSAVGGTMRHAAEVLWIPVAEHSRALHHPSLALPPPPRHVLYTPSDSQGPLGLELPLYGEHQLENLATALGIIECIQAQNSLPKKVTPSAIERGVSKTRWPGRLNFFQYQRSPNQTLTILADGAHNPSSAIALRTFIDSLRIEPRDVSFIVALSHSPPKVPSDTLKEMIRPGNAVIPVDFSPVEDMPWVVPVNIREMETACQQLVGPTGTILGSHEEKTGNKNSIKRLRDALDRAADHSKVAVVAGSLYLIADLFRLIEGEPEKFCQL
ncbi:FolC bifunctional protein [Serendipita vermifera]|nr:FolC bifunctional protein [Serendipita vermifera]